MYLGVFALASMGLNCLKYWAMPYGPGCDPSGSAACGVFVQASHPYRGSHLPYLHKQD